MMFLSSLSSGDKGIISIIDLLLKNHSLKDKNIADPFKGIILEFNDNSVSVWLEIIYRVFGRGRVLF